MQRDDDLLFAPQSLVDKGGSIGGSYLRMAYLAIILANRPLHTSEILEIAKKHSLYPDHLGGKTPSKTLNARLSEYIRKRGSGSLFFRTAPATYFISELAEGERSDETYRVFHGVRRSKTIKRERVLTALRSDLIRYASGELVSYSSEMFAEMLNTICSFVERPEAEDDFSRKQFVTFTVCHNSGRILIYRRGNYTTASDRLKGSVSVGFGGHINDEDFDLFNRGDEAILFNSSRELWEELYLDAEYSGVDEISRRSRILGFINVDDSPDAERHIAVLVLFNHQSSDLPTKGELSINELQWLDIKSPLNDTSDFDLWSRIILEKLFCGEIVLNDPEN